MKKLLMMVLVIFLVFSLVQVTVADDRLMVNGGLRVRAFSLDNETSYAKNVDDNQKYFDHRFRLGLAVTVAEGVTANLRTDLNDDAKWGTDAAFGRPAAGGPYAAGDALKTDRA